MGKGDPLEQMWAVTVALVIAGFLIAGGTSVPAPLVRLVFSIVSLVLLAASAWRLRAGLPTGLASAGAVLIGLMWLLFILQIVPIPHFAANWLPGRETLTTVSEAAGLEGHSRISLAPRLTIEALLATLPGVALFAAGLSVDSRYRTWVAGVVVALAIIAALLGVLQRFTGNASLYLYDFAPDPNSSSGFFANRNFFAAALYTSIPFLGAIALSAVRQQRLPGWLAAIFGLAYLCVILGGLAAAASRTGIILSMAAIVATSLLPWGSLNTLRTKTSRRVLLYGIMVFVFVFSQFGLFGLLRLAGSDPMGDLRVVIGRLTWTAIASFFPAGSGLGTFVPVFQLFETPAELRSQFVNHAHNDWLEIILEGGLPALILLVALLGWFGMACIRIWSRRSDAAGDLVMAASTISASLLMMHAVVDYPLRTPAIMALFGLCMGFSASAFAVRRVLRHSSERPVPPVSGVVRKPFTPFKPLGSGPETTPPGKPS